MVLCYSHPHAVLSRYVDVMYPPHCSGFLVNLMHQSQLAVEHGMDVSMRDPPIRYIQKGENTTNAMKDAADEAFKKAGSKRRPQLILCIKPGKEVSDYSDIKHASDVDIGVPSQCMIVKHARECKTQVIANILLKVNAKLGKW